MKPKRIQRQRTKGWKMPPNTVYVGRPGKWGNPYIAEIESEREQCKQAFRYWIERLIAKGVSHDFTELRGKNLACWCPLDQPCHADVLLEIANS